MSLFMISWFEMAFMWARGGDLIQYDCTSFVHLQQCGQHLVQPCCSWTCCDRPSNWCFSLPRCPILHTVRAAGVIETGVTLCKEARQQSIRHLRLGGRSRATRQPRHICMHYQLPPVGSNEGRFRPHYLHASLAVGQR
jgi:hypothetical protein